MIISVLMLSEKIYFSSILLRFSFPSERIINNIKERQIYHLTPLSVKLRKVLKRPEMKKKSLCLRSGLGFLGPTFPEQQCYVENQRPWVNCGSIFVVWSVQNITVIGDRHIHIIMLAN